MATGCCGVKRQKVSAPPENEGNHHGSSTSCSTRDYIPSPRNGSAVIPRPNGLSNGLNTSLARIVCDEMCYFCFETLYRHLHNEAPAPSPKFTDKPFPLFVTWKIGKEKRLRGCIGTFTAMNLHDGLREYAISSAFKDTRFQPITRDELSRLHVSVSLLRHFEDAKDWEDWRVGTHGIRIEFYNDKGNKKSATYLPEVPPEQEWTKKQTIDHLLRKGGYTVPVIRDEFRRTIRVTRYQSEKLTQSYADYSAFHAGRRQANGHI